LDLGLYLRVLWRWRVVVLVGLLLGSLLALLSVSRVEFDGATPRFTPRTPEVWQSASTLLVTQEGFPWGRTIFDETVKVESPDGGDPVFVPRFADPGRLSGLAVLYAELAKGDDVRQAFLQKAPATAAYDATVVKSTDGGSVLPMIYITGFGDTPQVAQHAANLATAAFRSYLGTSQREARIPAAKRVEVVVTRQAIPAELFEGRSVVRPIFLLLLLLMASIAVAFALENLRPATRRGGPDVRSVALPAPESHPASSAQRSA
jgi:hypothetical protein